MSGIARGNTEISFLCSASACSREVVERAVAGSGLPYAIARPSFITGPDRDEFRPGERIGAMVSDAALARTFDACGRYAEVIAALGAERVRFVATSASRDAENSAEFTAGVRRIHRRFGDDDPVQQLDAIILCQHAAAHAVFNLRNGGDQFDLALRISDCLFEKIDCIAGKFTRINRVDGAV